MSASVITSIATSVLLPIIERTLRRDNVPVDNRVAPQVARDLANDLAPVLVNKTNNEPWYQSRVTWGALVSIGTGLGTLLFGVMWQPQDAELIIAIGTAAGTVVGGGITLWGRWKARKPIGF